MSIDPEVSVEILQKQLHEAQEQITALQVIQEVAQSLNSELKLQPLLHKILRGAVEVMTASAGALILLDEATGDLVFTVTEGGGGEKLIGRRLKPEQGIAGWVAHHCEPLIVDDVNRDNRYYQGVADSLAYHVSSILCVPMLSRQKLMGVLQILHSEAGRYFSQTDQQLLTTFANHSAIAIENAQLHESLLAERDNLIVVEEEVRKQLARDLHDGPTQLVSSTIMNLAFTKELLKLAPDMVVAEIDRTIGIAERTLKQLRTVLFDLRPVILETQGLIPALTVYIQRLNEVEKFTVVLEVQENLPRLTPKAETCIFAVIQEAINNAKKYAQATLIKLIFQVDTAQNKVIVTVKDDGLGFDVAAVQQKYDERGSLGMINSLERAKAIHGTFQINSELQQGTTVTLQFPLSENILR